MKKLKTAAKAITITITTFLLMTVFATGAHAASLTFYKFNKCYNGYGYVETWAHTDYSWGEEFWLGKKDKWTYIRTDRASWLDTSCRTWYA